MHRNLFQKLLIALILMAILRPSFVGAEEKAEFKPGGKVWGIVFGDYFFKASGDSAGGRGQYSGLQKEQSAFQFRRLYMGFDYNLSENFTGNFLLESNDAALDGSKRHSPFIKLANVEWKNLIPNGSLNFGLTPTPTWGPVAEKVWNYRSIEKTIADFRGLGKAVDIGVSIKGTADKAGKFGYMAMIGNGNGTSAENNNTKKYYLALNAKPVKQFVAEVYVDLEKTKEDPDLKTTTMKFFAAYQTEKLTAGVEAVNQIQEVSEDVEKKPFGVSVFAWGQLPLSQKNLNAFARFDRFDPDTEVDDADFKENFITVGLDYMPIKNVHIMPNIWMNAFANKGDGDDPDATMVARLTLWYVYK